MMALRWLLRLLLRLQQGRRDGLIFNTNALLLRSPPLHKFGLGLQLGLFCLYILE
jgi:hypothetical protein